MWLRLVRQIGGVCRGVWYRALVGFCSSLSYTDDRTALRFSVAILRLGPSNMLLSTHAPIYLLLRSCSYNWLQHVFGGFECAFMTNSNAVKPAVLSSRLSYRCLSLPASAHSLSNGNNGKHRRLCTSRQCPRLLTLGPLGPLGPRTRIYTRDAMSTSIPFPSPHINHASVVLLY